MAKVKICGITSDAALVHAIGAGADYIGLVHFEKSPRHLSLDAAAALAATAKALGKARSVVLLVNPNDDLVAEVAERVSPQIIQLHGHETPQQVAAIRNRAPGCLIWKAVPVATRADVADVEAYLAPGTADLILFDAKPPADAPLPGGNGLVFDWTILDGMAERYGFALAGGLTPENVPAAIRLTGAAIVDVSSGVESAPGQKDPERVERFIAAAHDVSQTPAH